jgi:hypothetical protein
MSHQCHSLLSHAGSVSFSVARGRLLLGALLLSAQSGMCNPICYLLQSSVVLLGALLLWGQSVMCNKQSGKALYVIYFKVLSC